MRHNRSLTTVYVHVVGGIHTTVKHKGDWVLPKNEPIWYCPAVTLILPQYQSCRSYFLQLLWWNFLLEVSCRVGYMQKPAFFTKLTLSFLKVSAFAFLGFYCLRIILTLFTWIRFQMFGQIFVSFLPPTVLLYLRQVLTVLKVVGISHSIYILISRVFFYQISRFLKCVVLLFVKLYTHNIQLFCVC